MGLSHNPGRQNHALQAPLDKVHFNDENGKAEWWKEQLGSPEQALERTFSALGRTYLNAPFRLAGECDNHSLKSL